MSKKRPSPDSVICIDLTEDDSDDEQKQRLGDVRKSLACDTTSKKVKSERKEGAKVKSERKESDTSIKLDLNADGLEIVEPTVQPVVPVAGMPSTAADDGIEIVGARNETRLPHLRQDCTQFKFDKSSFNFEQNYTDETLENNQQCCDLCYCYVCDCPAKSCKSWHSGFPGLGKFNHCCGNAAVAFWKTQRSIFKATGSASLPHASAPGTIPGTSNHAVPARNRTVPQTLQGRDTKLSGNQAALPRTTTVSQAPVPALDVKSSAVNQAAPCQHILSWEYNLRPHNEHSHFDYCTRCGRVARLEDFGKDQATPMDKEEGELFLGYREVKFKILPHDIRHDLRYRTFWAVNAGQFSDVEMEDEVFRYQIGPNPKPCKVAHMLKLASAASKPSKDMGRRDHILVQSEHDGDLLRYAASSFSHNECDIKATWNKSSRQGMLRISIRLTQSAFTSSGSSELWVLMGLWFGIFPLNITDLALTSVDRKCVDHFIKSPHFKIYFDDIGDNLVGEMKQKLSDIGNPYGQATGVEKEHLKLLGSTGDVHQGFICPQYSASFSDLFRRFFSAKLSSVPERSYHDQVAQKLRRLQSGVVSYRQEEETTLGTLPSTFVDVCNKTHNRFSIFGFSIQNLMERMENLGHKDYGYVDGLNVELLEFQRQTLQWALERETMEGGVQMWFWGKLPDDPTRKDGNDIYFNPLLGLFRHGPPELVRGGLIAEEMGLGKTVISLALILENPAPEEPASGSHITDLEKLTIPTPWDKTLYQKTSSSNKKRGSILSRGTLVICPVSLVGQWVEEAKSKLKDPGLIYPYYGAGRKRNASFLARNSIVVTTYQVLASDATYHAKKGGEDYCAPLEQVRWWRMICDEGHMLREGSTGMSRAVSSLVADHKWLVSGTPLNTGFPDLTNQFKILGIEHADRLIQRIVGKGSYRRGFEIKAHPYLVPFLLGGLMIRHSQKQKYRGTETTLMSLPKKTERTITIKFSEAEKAEYYSVETSARDFYVSFCEDNDATCIGRNYLKLSQKLMPLRVACSGGKYPLPSKEGEEDGVGEEEDEGVARKKKPVRYSSFEFTSKAKTLIKELERARDSDGTSKSLVFSQFSTTLEWLQQELPKHGFQYRTLKGDMSMQQRAKALHDFQLDPPTTVFLLSIRAGAVGINLTQANRVFLMEPCLNPALEKQAIGRVHRLGQKREVEIIRLIHEDSIETRLLKFLKRKYGSSGSEEAEDVAAPVGPVGNLKSDKVQMMTDDFDLLFGVEGIVHGKNNDTGASSDAVADMVLSYGDDGVV